MTGERGQAVVDMRARSDDPAKRFEPALRRRMIFNLPIGSTRSARCLVGA